MKFEFEGNKIAKYFKLEMARTVPSSGDVFGGGRSRCFGICLVWVFFF